MDYAGMNVIVLRPTQVVVERSWSERLLSWPWRPWIKTRVVLSHVVPGDYAFNIGNDLFCSEEMYERLKASTMGEDARARPSTASPLGDLPPAPGRGIGSDRHGPSGC
jgi:hypothetical protein